MYKADQRDKAGISPLAAGAAGFVAGVVGAAAIAMKDEVIKEQAKKRVSEAKDTIKEKAAAAKTKLTEVKDIAADKTAEASNEIKDTLEDEEII